MDAAAYQVTSWGALAATIAGAAAALTGLLFVALSLNLRAIVQVPSYSARARETLGGLLSLLILGLLLLIPGQDRILVGIEIAIGGSGLAIMGGIQQELTIRRLPREQRRNWAIRLVPLRLGIATGTFAGISLALGQFGGLYWLVPTILIFTIWSIYNAWSLVILSAQDVGVTERQ